MVWKKEIGKGLVVLANIFATILVLGLIANLVTEEITDLNFLQWLVTIGIVSMIVLYISAFAGELFYLFINILSKLSRGHKP